jgi:hypothetical protein
MRPFRLRIRSVMIAVALLAGVIGGWRALHQAYLVNFYRGTARNYHSMASSLRAQASNATHGPNRTR